MSCTSNSNRSKLSAVRCGISKLGSSTAYTAAAVGGGALGGMAGTALGSLGGPVGMVIGGIAGGALGARGAITVGQERRWRNSGTGRQANQVRKRAKEDALTEYQAQTAQLSTQRKYYKQKFEDARDAGVAALGMDNKETARIAGTAVAKAAGSAALKAGLVMARQYHPDPRADAYLRKQATVAAARSETLRQAGTLAKQIEAEKTNRWLQTPGGQQARAEYQGQVRKLAVKQARYKQAYDARITHAETTYSRQREDFLAA